MTPPQYVKPFVKANKNDFADAGAICEAVSRPAMQRQNQRNDRLGDWLRELGCRRHSNVVACTLANKMARIAWAILAKGGKFRPSPGATLA